MTNEDAIKWLENLKQDIGQLRHENLWPYAQAIDEICGLLEEQQPRAMAIEEVKHAEAGSVAWIEWRREGKINSVILFRLINKGIDDSLEFHVLDGFVAARLACYGTEWRCWTSRPTEEQRKAVKWE